MNSNVTPAKLNSPPPKGTATDPLSASATHPADDTVRPAQALSGRRGGRLIGIAATWGVVVISVVYAAVLGIGLATLPNQNQPIGDPWFTLLELLIIALAPFLVALTAAIHALAEPPRRPFALLSLAFMSMASALTMAVHFAILTLPRSAPGIDPATLRFLLSFHWPSLAYAVDILAWDLFFPLALFAAAPAITGGPLAVAARRLMYLAAALAVVGLIGPISGRMALRGIGIVGYAVVFPVAAGLLLRLFLKQPHRFKREA